ncbi:MAG: FAD-linked oxidase C-terminal domain-containing protein [Desulfobacteraceae bacterium]
MNRTIQDQLKLIAGENNVLLEEEDLFTYSFDAAVHTPETPSCVVIPENIESVSNIIRLCSENGIPVTTRGAGTNLSGGAIPDREGIVVLTTRLDSIIEINEQDMYAVVQPGVVTADLAVRAESLGLFYPPDPGSQAVSTLGGNVAENAGGLRGLKYGVTKDYILGLSFIDSAGERIKTGSKTVKCATGYNLAGLLAGSEGTIGFIDEIILKLIPAPRARKSMMAVYNTIEEASGTVSAIIAERIVPATLELLDNFTIRAVEAFKPAGLPLDAGAMLLLEVDGHPAQVQEEADKVETLCRKMGACHVKTAEDEEERDRVWEARRSALSALAGLKPDVILEDATVPRSRIPDMVNALKQISQKYNIEIGTFGHAGDGNLHPTILADRRDKKQWRKVEKVIKEIFEKALALDGTLSGEHGTGLAKSPFFSQEAGDSTIRFSRRLKKGIDPKGIMNPGKIIGDS